MGWDWRGKKPLQISFEYILILNSKQIPFFFQTKQNKTGQSICCSLADRKQVLDLILNLFWDTLQWSVGKQENFLNSKKCPTPNWKETELLTFFFKTSCLLWDFLDAQWLILFITVWQCDSWHEIQLYPQQCPGTYSSLNVMKELVHPE